MTRRASDTGTIYISPVSARLLKKPEAVLDAAAVHNCSGSFERDDEIHIVLRSIDGGQRVIGTAIAHVDSRELERQRLAGTPGTEPVVFAAEFIKLPRPGPSTR